jgi:hypothetical protein
MKKSGAIDPELRARSDRMMRCALATLAIFVLACASEDASRSQAALDLEVWGAAGEPLPNEVELREDLIRAIELRQRQELVRVLDAREPGELAEEATLTQPALDSGEYGLDALFIVGDELFDLRFRVEDGLGNGLAGAPPNLRRVHGGGLGGPDAMSCSSCHSLGGLDGAGANTQNAFFRGDGDDTSSADERNPPHLLGLGPVEALAREITRDLRAIRDAAIADAIASGSEIERALETHGVSFGVIRANAAGRVDASGVEGVDRDLVIRPFGWKGSGASIRAMVEDAFRLHMGIVSANTQRRAALGELPASEHGDGPADDIDRDSISLEVEDGMLTTLVAYLAQLEVPEILPPSSEPLLEHFARGRAIFDEIGCASCHRPILVLEDPILETRPDHPDYADRPPLRIDVARDGEHPKIEPQSSRGDAFNVHLFSDLRRHDMGPLLASPAPEGSIDASHFLTRSLWGLAETAPYLHDGRAPTIEEAILLHGGEAEGARGLFAALDEDERASLRVFLTSLSRRPRMRIP